MSRGHSPTNQTIRFLFSLTLLVVACARVPAQEATVEKRPLLDLTGNKVFSKPELLEVVNSRLDEWAKNGSQYNAQMLDYCLHQMDNFMKSRGYLQAQVIMGDTEQTEAGPRVVLKVVEGPLYRVGKMKVDGGRLLRSEEIIEAIGLKPGDIASGEKLSNGLYESLKTRYAKFGYIQYTADVNPTFRAEIGAAEGVVDFALTIDEGEQFRIHSIKIAGADKALTDLLTRELMLRDGDIYDEDLFRESVVRLNRSRMVAPIDADKDTDFVDLKEKRRQAECSRKPCEPDSSPALLDIVIHVRKAENLSAPKE